MHEYALNEREKNKNIVQIQLLGIIDDRKLKTICDGDDMEEVERKSEGRGRNRKESGGGVFVFERRFCCLLCLRKERTATAWRRTLQVKIWC